MQIKYNIFLKNLQRNANKNKVNGVRSSISCRIRLNGKMDYKRSDAKDYVCERLNGNATIIKYLRMSGKKVECLYSHNNMFVNYKTVKYINPKKLTTEKTKTSRCVVLF